MTIDTRYNLNDHIFIILFQGSWTYREGDITSINTVIDNNGYHESYMINSNPNIFWNLSDVFPTKENIDEECNKRNTPTK